MNPQHEAYERIGRSYEVRVLEPSPPAVGGPWFADDPVARGQVPAGNAVVSPVGTGELTWDELVATESNLADWCAERWLAAYHRLRPAPSKLVPTRLALHRVAEQIVSPARRKANGKIGLRYTRGGFGTPFFGADIQIRVRGTELVIQDASGERTAPITTLDAAADLVLVWGEGFDFARVPANARTVVLNAYAHPGNAQADVFIPLSIQTERRGHYTNFQGVVSAFEPCFPRKASVADAEVLFAALAVPDRVPQSA